MARKEPTLVTIKRLYALSGNQCAFPDCTVKFVSPIEDVNLSEVCHIEAAEPGGTRYNSDSNDEERRSFDNLILLCPTHHTLVDSSANYSADDLRDMKKAHEDKMLQPEKLQKNPSALNTVIKYIGERIFEWQPDEPLNAPDPQEKIQYNNIIRYKPLIEEYVVYQAKLNKLYEEIEMTGSAKKENVLRNIKMFYLEEKGKYNTLENIRANADNIIDKVKDKLWGIIENSSNADKDLGFEVIQISLLIILVDAFMRCNILEEPVQV
jgi:hypothetical protein